LLPTPSDRGPPYRASGLDPRCRPWRAKRGPVVRGRRRVCKDIRHAVKPFVGGVGLGVCKSSPAPTAGRTGALKAVALASRFWGLGCPKIFHEVATLLAGWDRIEQIADVVVARGLSHREQAPGIAASLRHFQIALGIQERRALSEEDRERPHGGIGHGIQHVIAHAFIRKPLDD